jgi:hypothetical protein
MTTRRLNYTGCQRIRRSDIAVSMADSSIPPAFTLAHSLHEYEFPGDARVVVEAQAYWTLMRFECGTVDSPLSPDRLVLSNFDSPDGLRFRVKVIGTGEDAGLILGEADGIRAADPVGREEARSFLAVQPADLGHVAWRLFLDGGVPLLQINDKIPDWRSFMRRPEVRALMLPELYRQLLREAQRNPADAEASDAWQFAVLDMVPAAAGPRPSPSDEDAFEAWVEDAVRLFAGKHKLLRGLVAWIGVDP